MFIRKLKSVDAFVAVDIGGTPGRGVVRLAPKILQGGAADRARSVTYALASLGRQETGVSAGINAQAQDRAEALAAFLAEVTGWDAGYRLTAGKGVAEGELGGLEGTHSDELTAIGAVAAAQAALPGLGTAATNEVGAALPAELSARGITLVDTDDPIAAEVDVLFCGSKVGSVDHDAAARLSASVVVPIGPLPITARAMAVCVRRGIVALPDFVTTAGPLLGDADTARVRVAGIISEILDHPDGPTLGACERAEAFLSTWQEALPFGRPFAP